MKCQEYCVELTIAVNNVVHVILIAFTTSFYYPVDQVLPRNRFELGIGLIDYILECSYLLLVQFRLYGRDVIPDVKQFDSACATAMFSALMAIPICA